MPHLVHLDHDGNARLRLGTVLVNVAADPPQDRLRSRPEQTGSGPERQSMTIKTDCGTLGSIRCAKAVRLGELVSARSTPPSLLAQDMTGLHNAMTTASRTKGTFLHNLFHRQRDHPNLYGIDRYPVTPSTKKQKETKPVYKQSQKPKSKKPEQPKKKKASSHSSEENSN